MKRHYALEHELEPETRELFLLKASHKVNVTRGTKSGTAKGVAPLSQPVNNGDEVEWEIDDLGPGETLHFTPVDPQVSIVATSISGKKVKADIKYTGSSTAPVTTQYSVTIQTGTTVEEVGPPTPTLVIDTSGPPPNTICRPKYRFERGR